MMDCRITEIFYSLQGETSTSGWPTTFVRLTGCPLRCQYCDTAYAFTGGEKRSFEDILATVQQYPTRYVTVTGGEPLAQPNCLPLLERLCDAGYRVSLETSGAVDISKVDPRVVIILDIKTPGSKESHRNLWSNLDALKPHDEIKFVICHREDFDWCCALIQEKHLTRYCDILFSPSSQELQPSVLADWILEAGLPVRFQVQLHKILWGDARGK
jgi:7-carboxy-7-deazaguanine synthase